MSGVSAATMLSAGSLAVGAFGTISSAMAQQQQGAIARDVGNSNAMALEARALQIQNETKVRADIQRRENARKAGQIGAAYGAAGVDPQGTPLDVMADQATEGELQVQLINYGGATQVDNMLRQAQLLRAGGAAYGAASDISSTATLLTGAAKLGMAGANLFGGGAAIPASKNKAEPPPGSVRY